MSPKLAMKLDELKRDVYDEQSFLAAIGEGIGLFGVATLGGDGC